MFGHDSISQINHARELVAHIIELAEEDESQEIYETAEELLDNLNYVSDTLTGTN